MAIDKATLKEMVGKRITIDGVKHRVEKVVATKGLIVTRDGTEALADGVYKKGPGFFYDSPKGTKKKAPAAAKEEPVKETARARRAREKAEAEQPEETARERRTRIKREKAEAEAEEAKPARSRRRSTDAKPGAKGDGKAVPSKKKKLFEAFDQAIAERISQESYDLLTEAYGVKGDYAITPVAVGASFDNDALKITITVMSAGKSQKEIKSYIRDHREATDIASDDEEDDDLDDDDLEDDDSEDEDLEEDDDLEDDEEDDSEEEEDDEESFLAALNELSRADLRKIAKDMEIDDYKSFSKEDLAQELSEYEESDVRESAVNAGVELGDGDEEEDDAEDDDDDGSEDDADAEEPEEAATVEDLVGEVLEVAPSLKAKSITKFVEAFLANDECQEKFDGELVPGRTQLQEKGNKGPEMLLIGFDEENEVIKLLNISTGKTRSKTISEVVHMEILETPDDAE